MKKNIYYLALSLNVLLLLLCIVNWLPFILESIFVFGVYPFTNVINNSVDTTMLYHISNRMDFLIHIIYFIMIMVVAVDGYILLTKSTKDKFSIIKIAYCTSIILVLSYFLIIVAQGSTGGNVNNFKHLLNIIFWDINMGGLGIFSIMLVILLVRSIVVNIKVIKAMEYKGNSIVRV
ncbi:MAG: hypothetical protein ACRCTA_02570 [Bacilli bacterium]